MSKGLERDFTKMKMDGYSFEQIWKENCNLLYGPFDYKVLS